MMLRWLFIALVISTFCAPVATARADTLVAQDSAKRTKAKKEKEAGDRFMKAGRSKQAEAAYRKACKLDPGWHEAHEALGNLLFASRKYLKAVEAFKAAVKAEPRYATGYYNIAFAYRKARRFEQAAEYYQEYIKRKADDPDAYYGLAATLEALGRNKEAVENYLKYAEKETRPSERQYVVKARNRAEKLRKSLGMAEAPKPKPAPVIEPAPKATPKPAPKPPPPKPEPVAVKPAPEPPPKPAPKVATAPAATAAPRAAPSASSRPQPQVEDKRVVKLLAEGDAAMKQKSYTKAMKAYFDAVQLSPKNTDALYKLGLVYQATGNHKAAKMKWRLALAVDPNHAGAKQALEGSEAKAPAPEEPPPAARKPVAVRPQPAPAPKPIVKPAPPPPPPPKPAPEVVSAPAVSSGPGLTRAVAKAVPEIKKVTELVAQGDSFFKQKSYSLAIDVYTKATKLDPRNEEAIFKLGVAYAVSGNFKVAIYKWKQVLAINPNNKSAKRNIERAQAKLGGESATPQPETTAAKPEPPRPTSFEALMARAREMEKQGKAKVVIELVDQALKLKKDAAALMMRGEALIILRRYQEAKRAFSKAMVMNPNLAAPFYGLGETCRLSGDAERARYYFKMYVRSRSADVNPALVKKAKDFLGQ